MSDAFQTAKKFLLGGTAAVISKTTTAPFDRIKLILQLQPCVVSNGSSAVVQYTGLRDCVSRISLEQGVLSLWRGNGASVARCFPNNALNFAFRDFYRNLFLGGVDRKTSFSRFFAGTVAAGGAGGATALLICYPLDFARTRMAVDVRRDGGKRYAGIADCLQRIASRDGYTALYKGFSASVQFVVASRAVFFGIFDTIRTRSKYGSSNFFATWALAQSSLVVSGLTCYPLDTVRRRLMMQSGSAKKQYRNTRDCWAKIARTEGTSGFYRGALVNSLRSTGGALVVAIYYEFAKYL